MTAATPYDPFRPGENVRRRRPGYPLEPYPHFHFDPHEGGFTLEKNGKVYFVSTVEREYKEFQIVTDFEYSDDEYGTTSYPVYTTVYEDVETGLLVTNRLRFEKWWPNRANLDTNSSTR